MRGERGSVVVAMSGGVDSAAAAALLLREGWRAIGVTFRMWEGAPAAPGTKGCPPEMLGLAAGAARKLGIEHLVIDLRERFRSLVVEPFARTYLRGRTPNPCLECNRLVKFPALLEVADGMGVDAVASGHYARTCRGESGAPALMRAVAEEKDQSYVLYALGRETLSRCLFPNGEKRKGEVREMAVSLGLADAGMRESQEICFLCGGGYREFIARHYPQASSPGPLLDTAGRVLGQHGGIAFYTVGQRRGLGVSAPHPLYVTAIDAAAGAVIVGSREEVPGRWLRAEELHWVRGEPPAPRFEAQAMVRYNARPEPCRAQVSQGAFELSFRERAWAVTPGQHAVLYRGEEVLGGGIITAVGLHRPPPPAR